MTEIERILCTFSAAERELWHALYGAFPVVAEALVVPEWAPKPTQAEIDRLNRRQWMLAKQMERYVEGQKVRKRLEQRRKRKAA